jgi:hypothetical protein
MSLAGPQASSTASSSRLLGGACLSVCARRVPAPQLHSMGDSRLPAAALGHASACRSLELQTRRLTWSVLYVCVVCAVQWDQSKDEFMGKKQTEIFQEQVAFLVKREKYNLCDFYDGLRCACAKTSSS